VTGTNVAIASNWVNLEAGATSVAKASANFDWGALGSSVITALGDVAKVIEIVGQAIASGSGPIAGVGDDPGDGDS
jgi:hypothetical protein